MSSKNITFYTTPVQGVEVTKGTAKGYEIGQSAAALLTEQTFSGYPFQLSVPVVKSAYYYITVEVSEYSGEAGTHPVNGRQVLMLSVFEGVADEVYITAQSTIASAYCFTRFIELDGSGGINIYGDNNRIKVAHGMKNNFVHANGAVSDVISTSPNHLETNSYPLFNFLGNLLYYCLIDESVYEQFGALAGASGSFMPSLLYIIRNPFTEVKMIYDLISEKKQLLTPSLPELTKYPAVVTPVPHQWTLTIKCNDSGAQNFLIAGTAFVVFDKEDKAWIANNFRAGSPNSGTHCIVLNSDGSPADISPITGGGILGPGFGIAIDDKKENIAIGNFGWGQELYNPQHGSVSLFDYTGKVNCPTNGYTDYLSRVQGLCYDKDGNLWMSSIGMQDPLAPAPGGAYSFESQNSALVMYPGGKPDNALHYVDFDDNPSPYHCTFDVAIDKDGNAIASNIGNRGAGIPSTVYKIGVVDGKLKRLASWQSPYTNPNTGDTGYEELRQVAINEAGDIFVVAITSSRVIHFDKDLNYKGEFTKNINAPWGIKIDKQGTMFIANFGHEKNRMPGNTLDMEGPFGVTVIRDYDDSTSELMTVPTAGAPVMLQNGLPLYGSEVINGEHLVSYQPIMRLTSTNIDAAGNLWAMNNWKPSAVVDVKDNPGGDGVVIYIGVAEPE